MADHSASGMVGLSDGGRENLQIVKPGYITHNDKLACKAFSCSSGRHVKTHWAPSSSFQNKTVQNNDQFGNATAISKSLKPLSIALVFDQKVLLPSGMVKE